MLSRSPLPKSRSSWAQSSSRWPWGDRWGGQGHRGPPRSPPGPGAYPLLGWWLLGAHHIAGEEEEAVAQVTSLRGGAHTGWGVTKRDVGDMWGAPQHPFPGEASTHLPVRVCRLLQTPSEHQALQGMWLCPHQEPAQHLQLWGQWVSGHPEVGDKTLGWSHLGAPTSACAPGGGTVPGGSPSSRAMA